MLDLQLILKISFLLNPLSSIPVLFVAYHQKLNVKQIAFKSTLLGFAVAIAFVLIGPYLFKIYGIDINSFRAAGGLVIMLLGLSMAREKRDYSGEHPDALVSLIATPLLTGPATMSFLILTAAEVGTAIVLANLIFSFLIVGSFFIIIAYMIPRVNLEYVRFVSRLLGLFLIGLGLEMLVMGIKAIAF
ncbi:MAG TPA: MarC family protein [Candidatus Norongarragalinales archaeon]|nr:MarC family protein [Candidatus Norongarragalinales archaeon]